MEKIWLASAQAQFAQMQKDRRYLHQKAGYRYEYGYLERFRTSNGLIPLIFLYKQLKYAILLNPHSVAISVIDSFVDNNNFSA